MFWALNLNSNLSHSYYFNEKDGKSKIWIFVLTMVIKSANLKFKKYPRHGGHVYSIRRQGQGNDETRKILSKKAQK